MSLSFSRRAVLSRKSIELPTPQNVEGCRVDALAALNVTPHPASGLPMEPYGHQGLDH